MDIGRSWHATFSIVNRQSEIGNENLVFWLRLCRAVLHPVKQPLICHSDPTLREKNLTVLEPVTAEIPLGLELLGKHVRGPEYATCLTVNVSTCPNPQVKIDY